MAITSLASLRTAMNSMQRLSYYKTGVGVANPRYGVIWDNFLGAGLPSSGSTSSVGNSGAILSKASAGSLPFVSASGSASLYLAGINAQAIWDQRAVSVAPVMVLGMVHVWDRLWYNDGLLYNTTARRSWSPPALTRYTSGEGLSIWCRMISNNSGSGVVTFTLEYTNQAGTATSTSWTWNHAAPDSIGNANSIWPCALAVGDSGVRAVTAVTQNATIAAGSYGFTIQKYLGCYPLVAVPDMPTTSSFLCGLPKVDNDAFLTLGLQMGPPSSSSFSTATLSPAIISEIYLVEG
jgi:hypothetical protein